jgi:hypothetical protein
LTRIHWKDIDHEKYDGNSRGLLRKYGHRDQVCGMIGLGATRRLRNKSRTDLVYCLDELRYVAAYGRRVMLADSRGRSLEKRILYGELTGL